MIFSLLLDKNELFKLYKEVLDNYKVIWDRLDAVLLDLDKLVKGGNIFATFTFLIDGRSHFEEHFQNKTESLSPNGRVTDQIERILQRSVE